MNRQRGVTFIGMMFIGGLIVFAAIIGIKLIPAYIEYATITNHLREIARSPEAKTASVRDLQVMFDKRAQIDSINVIKGNELTIVKDGGQIVLEASYSSKISLFGNLSACIDFSATAEN